MLQTCNFGNIKLLPILQKLRSSRQFSISHLRRNAKSSKTINAAEEPVKGTPYSKMTIGVPKEIWQNERR